MKLLSGNRVSFRYEPETVKLFRDEYPWCKPFTTDPAIRKAVGYVYDHGPQYKHPRPQQITLALGSGCNRNSSYCSQETNHPIADHDPDILLGLFRKNRNLVQFARRFLFWGGEPLLYWDKLVYITEALIKDNLLRPKCSLGIKTNGLLMDAKKAEFLKKHNFYIGLSHNGPWQEGQDVLEEGTDTYDGFALLEKQDFVINSVITRTGFNRSELLNFFFAVLPTVQMPAIQSFQSFNLTKENEAECLYLEDPVVSMIVTYDQYRQGLAEKFFDFWPIVQLFKYRLAMQDYSILDSYNRFSHGCLNVDAVHIDLYGNIYSDHTFDCRVDKIMGHLEYLDNLPPMKDQTKFFAYNSSMKERCAGCPVLPLCLGGDIYTPEGMEDKECLQKFAFWAPLWTYFMNGYILETPITAIRDCNFRHKDIYLDYINSGVYQKAVKG